ncbi:MAG TPA: hypothetical protein VF633_03355 [Brevundimonas sp.]|jgi:hypothetical protein
MLRIALAVAAMACALPATAQTTAPAEHRFLLTGAGSFAVFADLTTIQRAGDIATLRSFQVVEPGFAVGGTAYWGGWSRWSFDCKAMTADRLDFASVREGGVEGPSSPDNQPAYSAGPGGDAAELLAVACGDPDRPADASTLEAAVSLGRAALAGDLDPH